MKIPLWATDGEYAYYGEVDESTVPFVVRRAATAAVDFGRRDLALPPVRVRWFDFTAVGGPSVYRARVGTVHKDGWTSGDRPDETWIRRGMTPTRTAYSVIHECSHVREFVEGRDHQHDDSPVHAAVHAASEAEAIAYADRHKEVAERIGGLGIRPNRAARRKAARGKRR